MVRAVLAFALLMSGASSLAAEAAPGATPEAEKLICKKQVPIGSLIATRRVCATKAMWDRNAKNAQDQTQMFTQPGAWSPNGPGNDTLTPGSGFDPLNLPR